MEQRHRWIVSIVLTCAGFGAGMLLLRPSGPESGTGVGHQAATASRERRGRPATAPGAEPSLRHGTPRFVDVTDASHVTFRHENGQTGQFKYLEIMGAGVGILDFDLDGWVDLYFVNGNLIGDNASPEIINRLYRNRGDGTFIDVTEKAGVGHAGYGQGCAVGDYDGDGDPDLYVSNFGPNVLYRNNGDGTFTDVSVESGLADAGWGQSCSFLDFDGDGQLDLYVQNYLQLDATRTIEAYVYVGRQKVLDYPSPLGFRGAPDRLYRNLGHGTFQDVTKQAGLLQPNGKGMGVACADLNDDGHSDLFVANDTMENYLFLNRGDGTFEESGLMAGVAFSRMGVPEASMGVDVGDYDGDGRPDLIVPCYRHQFFTLFRNMGDHFEDDSIRSGLAQATARATGFNGNFLDYDNDGDLDLFFTAGGVRRNESAPADASYIQRYGMPDVLVANDGQGGFVDVSSDAGPYFQTARIGRGSATGDLDNDGDLDLIVCNLADRAVILQNDTPGGHWVTLNLVAADGRCNPFGTVLQIDAKGRRQRTSIHGGVTYLSQSDSRVHFGLGAADRIDRLEIRWPDGTRQVLEDVEVDRFLTVTQGP